MTSRQYFKQLIGRCWRRWQSTPHWTSETEVSGEWFGIYGLRIEWRKVAIGVALSRTNVARLITDRWMNGVPVPSWSSILVCRQIGICAVDDAAVCPVCIHTSTARMLAGWTWKYWIWVFVLFRQKKCRFSLLSPFFAPKVTVYLFSVLLVFLRLEGARTRRSRVFVACARHRPTAVVGGGSQ